jgi:hypothetical protein
MRSCTLPPPYILAFLIGPAETSTEGVPSMYVPNGYIRYSLVKPDTRH